MAKSKALVLDPGFQVVAFKLQEASDMLHSDAKSRLKDALNDASDGDNDYKYLDHTGDGDSGDVIYSHNGDVRKAAYENSSVGGKQTTSIDHENSVNVVPCTTYEEEADEDDHYAGMNESLKAAKLYTELPLYERFISKGERENADEGSFAGKGKSFPILKPGDVQAAVHAMGRAGSANYGMAQLKANIIRIAKKKGWAKYLPKAWQDGSSSESLRSREAGFLKCMTCKGTGEDEDGEDCPKCGGTGKMKQSESARTTTGDLKLFESAATLEQIVLKEAKADYEIKLIAPGKGSSAFYPAEVLKRDGPKVFKAGTHVYLNHPTAAEEAARPEGDVKNLAGVLSTDAVYNESHPKGPGLYGRMKVFADHAQTVEEKAPHVGMSIRASGVAESGKKKDGLPILKELTSAESVDVVTRAGAGGMILSEAARTEREGDEVTLQEAQRIANEAVQKATAPLLERALRGDAREEGMRVLEGIRWPEQAKLKTIENAMRIGIPQKDGALDLDEWRKVVVAEAKSMGEVLAAATGSGQVRGLGDSMSIAEGPSAKSLKKEAKRQRKAEEALHEQEEKVFGSLTGIRMKEVA